MKQRVRTCCRGGGYRQTQYQAALESWFRHLQTRTTVPGVRSGTHAGTGLRKCPYVWSRGEIDIAEVLKDDETHGFFTILYGRPRLASREWRQLPLPRKTRSPWTK